MPTSENKDVADALEVVAGNPSPQELAAVVAVLREATSQAKSVVTESNWARDSKLLRDGTRTGDLEWRGDFKGEM